MTARALMTQAILETIAARLQTIALDDLAIQSVSFTVHLRAGGGWPRAITTKIEANDALAPIHAPPEEYVDSCGPRKRV